MNTEPIRAGQMDVYLDDFGNHRCKQCNDVVSEESIFHNEFHHHNPKMK